MLNDIASPVIFPFPFNISSLFWFFFLNTKVDKHFSSSVLLMLFFFGYPRLSSSVTFKMLVKISQDQF